MIKAPDLSLDDEDYINTLLARIEELEATILQMGENAAKDAKYYQARINELKVATFDSEWDDYNYYDT
jgi:restriction endonuclease S subunit